MQFSFIISGPKLKYIALLQLYYDYGFTTKSSQQNSYPISLYVLNSCCLIEIYISESEQCRVYLFVGECEKLHAYFDLQWELVLFLFDTVSVAVGYMAVQKLENELLDLYLCQCQM